EKPPTRVQQAGGGLAEKQPSTAPRPPEGRRQSPRQFGLAPWPTAGCRDHRPPALPPRAPAASPSPGEVAPPRSTAAARVEDGTLPGHPGLRVAREDRRPAAGRTHNRLDSNQRVTGQGSCATSSASFYDRAHSHARSAKTDRPTCGDPAHLA